MTELLEEDVASLQWPLESDWGSLPEFTNDLVHSLLTQGCCTIEVPTDDNAQEAVEYLARKAVWSRPRPTFAHAYFGGDDDGSCGFLNMGNLLQEAPWEDEEQYDTKAWELAFNCCNIVSQTCDILKDVTKLSFSFTSTNEPAEVMLRKQFPDKTFEEEDQGTIEQHLDFCRRRRICVMNFVKIDGVAFIRLTPIQQDSGWKTVELMVTTGNLFVFRNDLFNYHYSSASPQDLVLQTWIMEAAREITLPAIQGSAQDVMSFVGVPMNKYHHARMDSGNIEGLGGRLNISHGGDEMYQSMNAGCDSVVQVPTQRWDHEPFYDEDNEWGGAMSKHIGIIDTCEMETFDPGFWGIDDEHAAKISKEKYKALEAGYEILHSAGFKRETMRNAPIALGLGGFWANDSGSAGIPSTVPTNHLGSVGTPTTGHCQNHMFISYHLGLSGKCLMADTACSSSMVLTNELLLDMLHHRDGKPQHVLGHGRNTMALIVGMITLFDPIILIGGTQAHMIGQSGPGSTGGRTMSWDLSANGWGAGEMIGGFFFRLGDKNPDDEQAAGTRLASIVGTATNQDGRSASLTAPNGPSQTIVYQQALQNSGTKPGEVSMTECHATGTKLGDAIEFGSSRKLYMMEPQERYLPLPHGAFKTFTGHPQTGAGAAAIIKTVMTMRYCMAPPNIHLTSLNPNLDTGGYPHLMQVDRLDLGFSSMYIGCTGMGFGGTNSRVDMVGTCRQGHRAIPPLVSGPEGTLAFLAQASKRPGPEGTIAFLPQASKKQAQIEAKDVPYVLTTCPKCLGDMCFRCCLAFTKTEDYAHDHQCSLVREPFAAYDCCSMCYKGGYAEGVPPVVQFVNLGCSIYMVCNGRSDMQLMEEIIDEHGDVCYFQTVSLDDTQQAEFHFILDKNVDMAIYPVVNHAGPKTLIAGPDALHQNRSWLIDGSSTGMPAGTTYRVKIVWHYNRKEIDWSLHDEKLASPVC